MTLTISLAAHTVSGQAIPAPARPPARGCPPRSRSGGVAFGRNHTPRWRRSPAGAGPSGRWRGASFPSVTRMAGTCADRTPPYRTTPGTAARSRPPLAGPIPSACPSSGGQGPYDAEPLQLPAGDIRGDKAIRLIPSPDDAIWLAWSRARMFSMSAKPASVIPTDALLYLSPYRSRSKLNCITALRPAHFFNWGRKSRFRDCGGRVHSLQSKRTLLRSLAGNFRKFLKMV